MRQAYLVTYDICEDGRLRRVYRLMRGYGEHLQYSVFLCELTQQELVELRLRLSSELNFSEDQVLFVDLGPASGRARQAIEALGRPYAAPDRGPIVV